MKVYHGSYTEIDVIDLSLCETGKDFGQGYCALETNAG